MNINSFSSLLESLKHGAGVDWNTPFPMGVFGTLKLECGNSPLMGSSEDGAIKNESQWRRSKGVKFASHHKAFMPHFSPSGLSLTFKPGTAGVFEIFTYTPENWNLMIPSVDSLESFSPSRSRGSFYYYRTLAWLHLLPDNFEHRFFKSDKLSYGEERILPIPEKDWEEFPRVPCWVYSSLGQNKKCEEADLKWNPVIWYGHD